MKEITKDNVGMIKTRILEALQVCPDDLKSWENNNVHIQDALPYLNAAERELILTGTCGKCFDEMTGVFK